MHNLIVLLLVALPTGVGTLFVNEAFLVDGGAAMSLDDLLLIYLTLLLPVAFGGYLHQRLLIRASRRFKARHIRAIGILSSPLVLIGLGFMIYAPMLLRSVLPLAVGMILYVLLLRYPASQRSNGVTAM